MSSIDLTMDHSPSTVPAARPDDDSKGQSLWEDAFHRLLKNKMAVIGGGFLLLEILIAILTPWIAPYGFEVQDLEYTLAGPTAAHWMGTDTLGRDLFTRLLYGGRISMMVAFLASMVSVIVGVIYGANYQLQLDSVPGEGTCARIVIPELVVPARIIA